MCIALTEFTGLCGFRPQKETLGFVNSIPELKELIGDVDLSSVEGYSDNLKKAFTNLMQNSKDTIIEKVGFQPLPHVLLRIHQNIIHLG